MTVGTKSLLVGAHWPLHNVMVALSWRWLYGSWPTLKEAAAIALHDIGYLGCREMDGVDGTRHPALGAAWADRFLGKEYGDLIRGHSKGYADVAGVPLSRLYGPDKLSHVFEPTWLYAWRTRWTGELEQYKSVHHGCAPKCDDPDTPDREWFRVVRARMACGGMSHAISILDPGGRGSHNGR
jgi:hypothetical protein